ncbi:MAG: hypothetical protein H0Z24_05845 [Thermosipho sp. (in: Bacteria)]|nr:hypothetical protein [Thermosipho sp. (in: thermotogales)]
MKIIKQNNNFINEVTGEIIEPKFSHFTSKQDYLDAGIKPIEPMTAQEEKKEEKLEQILQSNSGYYVEEKLDGTRATIHFFKDHARVFSRRISKKTGWYVENTDLLPHIREIAIPELEGTIIDGEMYIPDRPFKDVSSTLNCLWDKAIDRQLELGFIHLKAFDILYYKGINIKQMPLWKRKQYLHDVVEILKSNGMYFIDEIKYSDDKMKIKVTTKLIKLMNKDSFNEKYPTLAKEIYSNSKVPPFAGLELLVSKKAYYEYIVALGGEGVILKNKEGKYYHKRTKEYIKVKKFDTWDCVIIDYVEPTMLYEGKTLKEGGTWDYWVDAEDDSLVVHKSLTLKQADDEGLIPVTKFYANDWIGAIKYGVVITDEELEEWKKKNPKEKPEVVVIDDYKILCVGETSGMTEEIREKISNNKEEYLGKVIEVKAQEVIKKTGKLRHPQFLRIREDKDLSQCIWKDHIRE